MKTPALAKISPPRLSGVYLRRPLFRLLDAARRRPLVWVCGPAGAGKTTLVASYLEARGRRHLWYQVDAGDGDVASFFHYLSLAVPIRSRRPLPRLTMEAPAGVGAFARRYFEAVFQRLPSPSVIVLDNFQEAPAGSVLADVLRAALDAIPSGMQLVVISRVDPPPALAAADVAGAIEVIGWPQLRLAPGEAAGIARVRGRHRGPPLSTRALARLHQLTDGWAAGLVLLLEHAALGGQDAPALDDPASHRIFDYFATELFARTDEMTRELLLRTSFLPSVTERMAEQLTGMRDAGRVLARVHRNYLFAERHGAAAGASYQYHPLFRAFLQDRAAATFSDGELQSARRAAAEVLVEHGRAEDAFELFRSAGDAASCIRLALAEAPSLMAQGRRATLAGWLASIPDEARAAAGGWIAYWDGVTCIGVAPRRSAELLARAFAELRAAGDRAGAFVAWAAVVQATFYEGMDFRPLDALIDSLEEMLRGDPSFPSVQIEAQVATGMLLALSQRRPASAACAAWAERAFELSRLAPAGQSLMTGAFLVIHYCFYGELGYAATVIDLLRDARRFDGSEPLVRVTVKAAEALFAFTRGDVADCRAAVRDGLAVADESGIGIWNDQLAAVGAGSALDALDLEGARAPLERMSAGAQRGGRFAIGNFHFYAAWEALVRRDLPHALRSAELATRLADEWGFVFGQAAGRLAIAQALLALDRRDEARAVLVEARRRGDALGSAPLVHSCLFVEADMALSQGDRAAAVARMREAFALGRARGLFNGFWMPAATVTRIAERALEEGIEVEHVREFVRRRRLRPSASTVAAWPWPVELLTLGRFSLLRDGAEIDVPRKAQVVTRLLKALAALGGDVAIDALADAIWPDAEADAARRALDTTLHRLRRLLGVDDAVRVADGKVRLDPASCRTDTTTLEVVCQRIDGALRSGGADAGGLEPLEERLLATYRGPLLAAETAAWVLSPRERLRERFVRSLVALARRRQRKGDLDRAIDLCGRGLDVDDLVEPLHRCLIECHRALGHEGEARRAAERCRILFAGQGIDLTPLD